MCSKNHTHLMILFHARVYTRQGTSEFRGPRSRDPNSKDVCSTNDGRQGPVASDFHIDVLIHVEIVGHGPEHTSL